MKITTSVLEDLLQQVDGLRPQLYFKSSLTALSHAMEDQVLAGSDRPLIIASFQRERFYRQEAHRYLRISERTDQLYVLAAPETDFGNKSEYYETVAFDMKEPLSQEWNLVVLGKQYMSCLICREREHNFDPGRKPLDVSTMDQTRRFEGIWTFDRKVIRKAADLLLSRIAHYRPELADKVAHARKEFVQDRSNRSSSADPAPFADRLVTYLQAGQYKLLKAYRSIATQERRERLINSITSAIRRSLDTSEICQVAVREMGEVLGVCRCLLYRCKATDQRATIQYEYLNTQQNCASEIDSPLPSLAGQPWLLQENPLFRAVVQTRESAFSQDIQIDPRFEQSIESRHYDTLRQWVEQWKIRSWLMVPVLYQDRLLGIVEVHHCDCEPRAWLEEEKALVTEIATQVGVALIQAEAYTHLDDLNQQLEALDRTRSNLVAITGHELRTPLSTIQVCLESLASEPDMPRELQQLMLQSALADADRMRKLIQDFLTLSRLESGRINWRLEPLPIRECVDLALSSLRSRQLGEPLPQISTQVSQELPLIQADGEWLVEVLAKLIDNACKFTQPDGEVVIAAQPLNPKMMEVTVTDTGRGIEPSRLEKVFERFYQEEGSLRRSAGGTGLGLAICRQIVTGLGGEIWAESDGRDRGSKFHFTIPIFHEF